MSNLNKLLDDLNSLQDERINLSKNHHNLKSVQNLDEVREYLKAHERIQSITEEMIKKTGEAISLTTGEQREYLTRRLDQNLPILAKAKDNVLLLRATEKRILSTNILKN